MISESGLLDYRFENEAWHTYYDIFVRHAFGSLRDVLTEVSYSPMMVSLVSPSRHLLPFLSPLVALSLNSPCSASFLSLFSLSQLASLALTIYSPPAHHSLPSSPSFAAIHLSASLSLLNCRYPAEHHALSLPLSAFLATTQCPPHNPPSFRARRYTSPTSAPGRSPARVRHQTRITHVKCTRSASLMTPRILNTSHSLKLHPITEPNVNLNAYDRAHANLPVALILVRTLSLLVA